MRYTFLLRAAALPALLGLAACVDLNVENPNAPDASRVIASAADVDSLVSGTYNTWFRGIYAYHGPGMGLSAASFQHSAPWSCCGMEWFSRLPRQPIINDSADQDYEIWTPPWFESYRAISAAAAALAAMQKPAIAAELGSHAARDRTFAYFGLGMAHATVALLYDRGFVRDEATDLTRAQTAQPYGAVMTAAIAYFDEALAGCAEAGFSIPKAWLGTDGDVGAPDLARIIHSMKARYLVEVARTPAERAAVDWTRVIAEVDAGITAPFVQNMDWNSGWWANDAHVAETAPDWSRVPYFVWGMADQSGNYQLWLSTPLTAWPGRQPIINGRDIVIVTPDLRFPQGETVADQTAHKGKYVVIPTMVEHGVTPQFLWARPDRGTWRWSWYLYVRSFAYQAGTDFHLPEIPLSEMDLLKAEGLYRTGDRAGAAALVNKTRVAVGGLNPTDAAGTNTSCVPKLPDGRCGDLFEMIKWEKRLEGAFQGLGTIPWYFDSRGWGDLYKGTPLQFPIPCSELRRMGMQACYTFGGAADATAAPLSVYAYPGEG